MSAFFFDRRVQRYRFKDSGKFANSEQIRHLSQSAIALVEKDLHSIGDLLIERKISLATWEEQTQKALKQLHLWNYLLGIGGEKMMAQSDYGILGARLKEQYGYLRNSFITDLRTGMSQAQFKARLSLYTAAARGSYERARLEAHSRAGFYWERRRRTKTESCAPCVAYAAMGWQVIGTLPNPTTYCDCKVRCGCYKEYSKDPLMPRDGLCRRWGWVLGENLKPRALNDRELNKAQSA